MENDDCTLGQYREAFVLKRRKIYLPRVSMEETEQCYRSEEFSQGNGDGRLVAKRSHLKYKFQKL